MQADVMKLVNMHDSKSCAFGLGSSILPIGTKKETQKNFGEENFLIIWIG